MIEYQVPGHLGIDGLTRDLRAGASLEFEPRARLVQTFLDTFDWRIHSSGHSLLLESDASGWRLIWRERGGQGPQLSAQVGSIPRWPADLPAGPFGERIRSVLGVRSLLPLGERRVSRVRARVLDAIHKTILKLRIEQSQSWGPTASNRRMPNLSLWLDPLTGYHKSTRQMIARLEQLGLRRSKTDLVEQCYKSSGLCPEDRAHRLRVRLDRRTPANQALKRLLAPLARAIIVNVGGVIQNHDTECLHDLRVAVRRTRAALTQTEGLWPHRTVSRYRAEFGWLAQTTGPLRDLDVFLLEFDDRVTTAPPPDADALHHLLDLVGTAQARERKSVIRALSSSRCKTFLADWNRLLSTPGPSKSRLAYAERTIIDHAQSTIRVTYKRVRRQGRQIDSSSDEALHKLRKSCKALRYSLELYRSLFPKRRMDVALTGLKKLQDVLGAVQDAAVQTRSLRLFAGELANPGSRVALESLAREREHRGTRARQTFVPRFEAFMSGEVRLAFNRMTSAPK